MPNPNRATHGEPERIGESGPDAMQSDNPAAAARMAMVCRAIRRVAPIVNDEHAASNAHCTRRLPPDACDESRNNSHNPPKNPSARTRTEPRRNRGTAAGGCRSCREHRVTRCRAPRASSCPNRCTASTRRSPAASEADMGRADDAQASRLLPRAACLTRLPGAFPGNVKARKCTSTSTRVPRNAELTATKDALRPSPEIFPCPRDLPLLPRDLPFSHEIFPCSPRSPSADFFPFSPRSSLAPRSSLFFAEFWGSRVLAFFDEIFPFPEIFPLFAEITISRVLPFSPEIFLFPEIFPCIYGRYWPFTPHTR